jgi:ATP-dependent Lhr-like helicase
MTDFAARLALKQRLPRTWTAFFERHGNFTDAQVAAIPALLDGHNVVLCAPTASGKTEAVTAPLIERYCPPVRPRAGPRILYLTPTRALVNDLHARLMHPLRALGISIGSKTGDRSSFRPAHPPDVLLTTPESADSMLATHAKLFAHLRAVVIDELHLLDGTPRGDQLRVVLNRIRRICEYACEHGDAPDGDEHIGSPLQFAALSATLGDPQGVVARYFDQAQVIHINSTRVIKAEHMLLEPNTSDALIAYLHTFRARGWRKALVFCNSRAEVEAYAAAMRAASPFGDAVYVHYSNIEAKRRYEIERQFAHANAAICFSSSTLELGIDIGDIDCVLLIGPPGSLSSFVQRIGRGNRRRSVTRVACFYRTPFEQAVFAALTSENSHSQPLSYRDRRRGASMTRAFHPSVAVQQIFSLLKQSPIAAVRLAELTKLFTAMLSTDDLQVILGQLCMLGYLQTGRPGEWRAGPRLNKLFDEQASAQPTLSIYSNIEGSAAHQITIRDQHTQQTVATVDRQWFDRPVLTLEGRPVNVEWYDGEALWVASSPEQKVADQLRYRSVRQLLDYELAQLLPLQWGLPYGATPLVAGTDGWWWFHWLGDLYGRAVLDLLRYRVEASATEQIGLCLELADGLQALPDWTEAQVVRYLQDNYRVFEPLLALGPFHHLLPVQLRRRAVVEQFGVNQFLQVIATLRPVTATEALANDLIPLLANGHKADESGEIQI